MPTARKEAAIGELAEKLAAAKNLFLTDYSGLTVDEITRLRGELRKDGNTLLGRQEHALPHRGRRPGRPAGERSRRSDRNRLRRADPVAPAKALKTFSDTVKRVAVKAAYIDGQVVDAQQIEKLAKLPPKTELIAMLVGTLANPIRGLVTVLSGNQSGLVRVLDRIREQKAGATSNA